MRTTVTLSDDVAAALDRLQRQEGLSPKEVINLAVREFVTRRSQKLASRPHKTPTVDLGRCLVGSLDDVSEALAFAEGEGFR
jgi:predicted transcriptional regulator